MHAAKSAESASGQPVHEKGKRPEENHVSSTSSSCRSVTSAGEHPSRSQTMAIAASSLAATTSFTSSPRTSG